MHEHYIVRVLPLCINLSTVAHAVAHTVAPSSQAAVSLCISLSTIRHIVCPASAC